MCLSGARGVAPETRPFILYAAVGDISPERGMKTGSVALARLIAFLLRRPHVMGRPFKAVTTSFSRRVSGFFSPVAGALSVCISRAGNTLHNTVAAKLYGGSHLVPQTMAYHSGRAIGKTMGKMESDQPQRAQDRPARCKCLNYR